jgi:arylsulfatase A-like enzyme
MNKHFSIHFFAAILLALLSTVCNIEHCHAAERPNILFLFADDQRDDAIGAYGNALIETPNIDRLVRAGYSFNRAYCMGSMHGAVCQPSRAMLNSGRSLYNVPMDLNGVLTLGENLQQQGYTTFGTGKWHNGGASFARSFEIGKSLFLGGMSNHELVPICDLKPDKSFTKTRTGEKFSSELFADAAIDFLNAHDGNQPFYAYVAFTAPHDPRQPPREIAEHYYEKHLPLPKNFLPQHPFNNGWLIGRDENLAAWPRTEEVVRDQLAEYYGLITHLDTQIGRILKALADNGFAENTVIVYAADHGLAVGSHGLLGKQSVYEHSMGAPLFFSGAGVPQGSSDALVYLYDINPTICALAQTRPDEKVEGFDLAQIWQGKKENVRNDLLLAYEDIQRAWVSDRWKVIRYPKINKTQLFDLQNDPAEMHDLSHEAEHAALVENGLQRIAELQKEYNDTCALTVDRLQPETIDLTGHKRKPDQWQPQWIIDKYFDKSSE